MKLIQWRSWKGCAATVFCLSLLLVFLGWFALGFLPRPLLLEGVSFGKIALDAKGGILKICLADDENIACARIWIPLRPRQSQPCYAMRTDIFIFIRE